MERLTRKNDTNTGYFYPMCFEKCDGMGCSDKCNHCKITYEICEKLGKYEDTNLTPEQIVEIDKLYAEKCKELAEVRNKTIDELARRIELRISESIIWGILANMDKDINLSETSDKIIDYVIDSTKQIAKHMKESMK